MAIEHANIQHSDTHEPKHITNATTADHGKVITPSLTQNGVSVLQNLQGGSLRSDPGNPAVIQAAGKVLETDGSGGFSYVANLAQIDFGTMEMHNLTPAITTIAAGNTYYPFDTGWSPTNAFAAGALLGVTFVAGPPAALRCTRAGKYLVFWTVSMESVSGAARVARIDIAVDGTPITGYDRHYYAGANDSDILTAHHLITVTAGQDINLHILNETAATNFQSTSAQVTVVRLSA